MTSPQPTLVFLDIRIGDPSAQAAALDAYSRATAFIAAKGAALGVDGNVKPEALEDWQREMVLEAYQADPVWRAKGPISVTPPPSLPGGRLHIRLHTTTAPKTTLNFSTLCTGSKGLSKSTKKPLHFLNTPIHRLIPSHIAQGGDITRHDGSGGDSIYSGTFNDEKDGLKAKFTQPFDGLPDPVKTGGVFAMANSGKNSNTSQWFVTLPGADTKRIEKMNGKYVVFGHVVQGSEVLQVLNAVRVEGETPKERIEVVDCGVLE
ncbi:cyclophilin [Fimicolochytrium jonesii]|uniref:cyclophilin n=1 Tax=Fimicolochytrium jonesii TaxID=1396493 RepID=UPI0022FED5EF|nr:cyclophilin [Fimicolochytrium jonesii]KAI8819453.1 cyclophilin [Fimicolochytrium jonesii]